MRVLLALLAVYALLGRPDHVATQPPAANRPALNDLFVTAGSGPPMPGTPNLAEDKGDKPAAYNKAELKACCVKIAKDIQRVYLLNNRNGKMKLQVRGLYTRGPVLFFALRLKNRSPLDYDVDSVGFFVMQKRQHKQPPVQLRQLSPVYVYDSAVRVKSFGRVTSVMVLPRLKLGRGQRLLIKVSEKNGIRQLQVLASPFILANARLI